MADQIFVKLKIEDVEHLINYLQTKPFQEVGQTVPYLQQKMNEAMAAAKTKQNGQTEKQAKTP